MSTKLGNTWLNNLTSHEQYHLEYDADTEMFALLALVPGDSETPRVVLFLARSVLVELAAAWGGAGIREPRPT